MATVKPFGADNGFEMGYAVSKGARNTLGKYMTINLGRKGYSGQHMPDGLDSRGAGTTAY